MCPRTARHSQGVSTETSGRNEDTVERTADFKGGPGPRYTWLMHTLKKGRDVHSHGTALRLLTQPRSISIRSIKDSVAFGSGVASRAAGIATQEERGRASCRTGEPRGGRECGLRPRHVPTRSEAVIRLSAPSVVRSGGLAVSEGKERQGGQVTPPGDGVRVHGGPLRAVSPVLMPIVTPASPTWVPAGDSGVGGLHQVRPAPPPGHPPPPASWRVVGWPAARSDGL